MNGGEGYFDPASDWLDLNHSFSCSFSHNLPLHTQRLPFSLRHCHWAEVIGNRWVSGGSLSRSLADKRCVCEWMCVCECVCVCVFVCVCITIFSLLFSSQERWMDTRDFISLANFNSLPKTSTLWKCKWEKRRERGREEGRERESLILLF